MEKIIAARAKQLRKEQTDAENLLWGHLRAKRFSGYKFKRQAPIGKFIADFVCFQKKLIIELDGGQHAIQQERDRERDEWLKENGFRVIRFWNHDLFNELEAVLEDIKRNLDHPLPIPSPIEGRGVKELNPLPGVGEGGPKGRERAK